MIVKNILNKSFNKPEPMLVGTWEAIVPGYYLIHNISRQTKSVCRNFIACYRAPRGLIRPYGLAPAVRLGPRRTAERTPIPGWQHSALAVR